MAKKKTLLYVIIFFFITLIVLLIYISILIKQNGIYNVKSDDNYDDYDDLYGEPEEVDEWGDNTDITTEDWILESDENTFSYLLIKQCLKKFYSSTKDNYNLIDFEAKELLNITENSYNNLKDLDFYIDEIYMANVKKSKDIYLVYYRIQKDNASCSKSEIAIKVDVKNYTFSVYPYEFLKKKGYLNLKENDKLILENIEDIEENDFNRFRVDEIKKDDETLMKEILEKYKFDLNYDIEHLYNTLNIEYKRSQFKNIEDFKKFINKNKQLLIKDEIDKFDVNNNEYDTKYIVYGNNNIQYTFNVNSMLDYDLIID